MWIPVVGYWVAYFTMIFTFLATYSLPAIIGDMFSGGKNEISGPISIVRTGGPALTRWEYLWPGSQRSSCFAYGSRSRCARGAAFAAS
jgi:hypothetical protein